MQRQAHAQRAYRQEGDARAEVPGQLCRVIVVGLRRHLELRGAAARPKTYLALEVEPTELPEATFMGAQIGDRILARCGYEPTDDLKALAGFMSEM